MLTRRRFRSLAALGIAAIAGAASQAPQPGTPRAAVEELLTADVSFSAASATRDLVNGLGAMFAEDVVAPLPGRGFVDGKAAVLAGLREDSLNATSRAVWSPMRGGISADGRHGFTYGYMTVMRADGSRLPLKYLAYWVKGDAGWRVAAYRRSRRPEGEVSMAMLPPALPDALVAVTADIRAIDAHRTSLAQAESDFSDEAQRIGVGPAFTKYGSADAMNMGGPGSAGFLIGNDVIGRTIGGENPGEPATINWSPDRVIVASSGDLGVSIGFIRQNAASTGTAGGAPAAGIPFFTIWRRADKDAPWRYVAE